MNDAPVNPWARWSWMLAGIWLVFLIYPILETLQTSAPAWAKALTLACLAAFAVVYILAYSRWSRLPLLCGVLLLVLGLATVPVLGVEAVGLTPYIGAFAALQVPAPYWPWATVVAALLPLFSLLGGGFPMFFFLMVWPIIGACVLIRLLDAKHEEQAEINGQLALVAERERVARDVHDVLGHSLTALSVKAELAGRLIDVDPQRAQAELESIQETAREALAEVRSTVGGLRAGNLETELANGIRVLNDAGVAVDVVGEVNETDPRHRALLAWVLREGVTNVVRHAEASRVSLALTGHGLTIADDGVGVAAGEGNGLRGMRERVDSAGGRLRVESADPGTRLEVVLG